MDILNVRNNFKAICVPITISHCMVSQACMSATRDRKKVISPNIERDAVPQTPVSVHHVLQSQTHVIGSPEADKMESLCMVYAWEKEVSTHLFKSRDVSTCVSLVHSSDVKREDKDLFFFSFRCVVQIP